MQINTLDFNSKPGEIIPYDDIPDSAIEQYFLTDEQSRLKEVIWKT